MSELKCLFSSLRVSTSRVFLACLAAASITFFGVTPAQAQQDQSQPIHIVPFVAPGSGAPINTAPPAAHLNYYGGPVVSNIQVVVVYWGSSVSTTFTAGLPGFYKGVTDSVYFDLLSEYSTNITPTGGGSGTNQSIGRGSYGGAFTITPSVCNVSPTPCVLSDTQIQNELVTQITAANLPTPEYDVNGRDNTEYMIYFPPGVSISSNGGSCVPGGFCAYHGTNTSYNSKFLAYGVFPDFGTGSGCDVGCGSGTEFQNMTSTSSHELVETVTDIAVGKATSIANPLAWYDPNTGDKDGGGEIGDICNQQHQVVATPLGNYTVQQEWSNAENGCVATGLHPNYDLTVPGTATAGTPLGFTLTVQNPAGGLGTDTSFVGTVHFTSTDGSATLPADYTFVSADQGTHNFSVTFESGGPQSLTATDTVNSAITATAPVTVNKAPAITSANNTTFNAGSPGTFTVTTTGYPTPSITESGTLPSGVTFNDNGNGTGTLAGTSAAVGTYHITFTAKNGVSPNAVQNFTLTIKGPLASFSPNGFNFGDVQVDTRVVKSVILKNTGNATLLISNIELVQAGGPPDFANAFALTYNCAASLAPGQSCKITLTLFDDRAETLNDAVEVDDNVVGSPQFIPIFANVTEIDLSFKPKSLVFPATTVGTSVNKTVTLTNLSNTTLSLNAITITGANASDFTESNNCPPTMQPNGHCTLIVTFAPGATGSRVAGLMVTANGGSTQQTLSLSGTGN